METETKPKGVGRALPAWCRPGKGRCVALAAVAMLAAALLCTIFWLLTRQGGHTVATAAQASLQKVLEISDLSTLDYTYNSIVEVCGEDGDTPKYYVAYEGAVTAGIDFTEISLKVDEGTKQIDIILPDAQVQSVRVDMGSMEFIFLKDRYETETISQEAYQASLADLKYEAAQESQLLNMAKENAAAAIEALIEPWTQQLDGQYTVTIQ